MKLITLALLLFGSCLAYSQEAIDLIESTLKLGISEEKEYYFGFAEGDQIVLNFEEKINYYDCFTLQVIFTSEQIIYKPTQS